jgi:integrase
LLTGGRVFILRATKVSLQKRNGKSGKPFYQTQFYLPSGKRTTIRFGNVSQKAANEMARHVDHLVASKKHGTRVNEATIAWLQSADKDLVDKLHAYGLCRMYDNPTIAKFAADFVERKKATVKGGTLFLINQVVNHLNEFFHSEKRICDVRREDAEKMWHWLLTKKKLGKNTAKRQLGRIREIFKVAVSHEVIFQNPFDQDHLKVTVGAGKKEYIPAATIKAVIEHCVTTEWKLLFAFGRFVGCRMPSEIQNLTWDDVNRESNTILLKSPKTEHHEGRSERVVPIFPEIDALLSQRWAEADEGEVHVFPSLRHHSNTATTAAKFVKAAGFAIWPKFWNSMRASCETDLMDRYGLRRACAWIGNSPEVAMKHYALIKRSDYADDGEKSDAKSDAAQACMALPRVDALQKNPCFSGVFDDKTTPHGFEP